MVAIVFCPFQILPRRRLYFATWTTSLLALDHCGCRGYNTHFALPRQLPGGSIRGIYTWKQSQYQPFHNSFLHERGWGRRSIYMNQMPPDLSSTERRRSARIRARKVTAEAATNNDDADDGVNRGKRSHNAVSGTKNQRSVRPRRKAVRPKRKMPITDKKEVVGDKSHTVPINGVGTKNSSKLTKGNNGDASVGRKDNSELLLDLGPLVQGKVIKRPSATIRSPYVADVEITADEQENGETKTTTVQAHSPALDVGGLCSPGATVFMSKRPPGGKTSHVIELVSTAGPNRSGGKDDNGDNLVLVGAHPRLGEILAEEVLKRGLLQECISYEPAIVIEKKKSQKKNTCKEDYCPRPGEVVLHKQQTYNDSRVDFELIEYSSSSNDNSGTSEVAAVPTKRALIEVKNVVCSDYSAQDAPEKTGPNHCVIIAPSNPDASSAIPGSGTPHEDNTYHRSAIFPWGRVGQTFEGKKVVSERAIKHIRNLAKMASSKKEKDLESIVLFVINRSDCEKMRACHEACPVFASELTTFAKQDGCSVVSFRVVWTKEGKSFFDGIVPVEVDYNYGS